MIQPRPGKSRGKAIRWSDSQLDTIAEVTPSEQLEAAQLWRDEAPPALSTLLDAPLDEEPLEGLA